LTAEHPQGSLSRSPWGCSKIFKDLFTISTRGSPHTFGVKEGNTKSPPAKLKLMNGKTPWLNRV